MNLIALFLGLGLERGLTRLLHLRDLRWLDGWFDKGLTRSRTLSGPAAWLAALTLIVIPVLPVAWLQLVWADDVPGPVWVLFAAFVLLFSLGPRDLLTELSQYLAVAETGDEEAAARSARGLIEGDAELSGTRAGAALESAIVVQANHRIFSVLFWFVVLGPAGAWASRVADLGRRRAAPGGGVSHAVEVLHGMLAWIPARLLALSYAVAGSFEDAVADWRDYYRQAATGFFRASEAIVAAAGVGAIRSRCPQADVVGRVRAARRLVVRTLVIWLTVISLLTIVGHLA
jgi:membrane protein required for beta-lactamase induction